MNVSYNRKIEHSPIKLVYRFLKINLVFVVLTVISQIGGIVYLISLFIASKIKHYIPQKKLVIFLFTYLVTTFLIVPNLAPLGGRVKIESTQNLKPANLFTILLNRNYVSEDLAFFLTKLSNDLDVKNNKIHIQYLDACFPFMDGFPLLPHLSHNDGKKIDFCLVYENDNGNIVNKSKSLSGYGVFEEPTAVEINQCKKCKELGYFQYDFPKYLKIFSVNSDLKFSIAGTRSLIQALLEQDELEKLFIEPHLKERMQINHSKIRFHECMAVRHDDHIHVQIK